MWNKKLKQTLSDANRAISCIDTVDITESCLLYATAMVVTETLGYKIRHPTQLVCNLPTPPWEHRLSRKIDLLRGDLSRLKETQAGRLQCAEKKQRLFCKYNIPEKSISSQIEALKQQVQAYQGRLDRYRKQKLKKSQNFLFANNQRELYRKLNALHASDLQGEPDKVEIKMFWEQLWSNSVDHNKNAEWLLTLKDMFAESVHDQAAFKITSVSVSQVLKRFSNWKAPGSDAVHAIWLKHLPSLHSRIAIQLQQVLVEGPPRWMTTGRTILLLKDKSKGPTPTNFRPITCLPVLWKLLTAILTREVYKHLRNVHLLPHEQKGCTRPFRASKHEL